MKVSSTKVAFFTLGLITAGLIGLSYFVLHFPIWVLVPIALAAVAVNAFILRVEDGEYSKREKSEP